MPLASTLNYSQGMKKLETIDNVSLSQVTGGMDIMGMLKPLMSMFTGGGGDSGGGGLMSMLGGGGGKKKDDKATA